MGDMAIQVFQMTPDQADSLCPLCPGFLVKEVAFHNPDVERPPGGGQFQGAVRRQRRMAEDIRHFLPVNGRNDEGMQAGDVEEGLALFPAGLKSGKCRDATTFRGSLGERAL